MKIKKLLLNLLGILFFVKAFEVIEYLFIDTDSLLHTKMGFANSRVSYYPYFSELSSTLFFITVQGFFGLLIGTSLAAFINRRSRDNQKLSLVAGALALFLNKMVPGLLQLINRHDEHLSHQLFKPVLLFAIVVAIASGSLLVVSASRLKAL